MIMKRQVKQNDWAEISKQTQRDHSKKSGEFQMWLEDYNRSYFQSTFDCLDRFWT